MLLLRLLSSRGLRKAHHFWCRLGSDRTLEGLIDVVTIVVVIVDTIITMVSLFSGAVTAQGTGIWLCSRESLSSFVGAHAMGEPYPRAMVKRAGAYYRFASIICEAVQYRDQELFSQMPHDLCREEGDAVFEEIKRHRLAAMPHRVRAGAGVTTHTQKRGRCKRSCIDVMSPRRSCFAEVVTHEPRLE